MGFLEGEGCFNIGLQRYIDRKPRKTGRKNRIKRPHLFQLIPNFRLAISEGDNEILKEIKERFGFGGIYTQNRSAKNFLKQNVSYYYVQGQRDTKKIRGFFSKQRFYTRKKRDFELWCKCLDIIESRGHLTDEGLLKICGIRDNMNSRKNKSKWSRGEVKRILQAKPEHIAGHVDPKQQKLIHNTGLSETEWIRRKQGNHKKGPYSPKLDLDCFIEP